MWKKGVTADGSALADRRWRYQEISTTYAVGERENGTPKNTLPIAEERGKSLPMKMKNAIILIVQYIMQKEERMKAANTSSFTVLSQDCF